MFTGLIEAIGTIRSIEKSKVSNSSPLNSTLKNWTLNLVTVSQ